MSEQYLVIHMSDQTGTELSQDEDRRTLAAWADEGNAAGRLQDGFPGGRA